LFAAAGGCSNEPTQTPVAVNDPCRLSIGEARQVELVSANGDQLAYPEVANAIADAIRGLGATYPDLDGFPERTDDAWALHHVSHAPRSYMVDPKAPRFEIDLNFSLFISNTPEKHTWENWLGDLRVSADTKGDSAAADALNDVLECACKTMNRIRGEGTCGPEPEQRIRRQSIVCNPLPDKEPEKPPEEPKAEAPPPAPAKDPNRVLDIDSDIDELRSRTSGTPQAESAPKAEPTAEELRARAGEVKSTPTVEADDAAKNACMLTWWLEEGHHAGF
jgi:hypothetical protein